MSKWRTLTQWRNNNNNNNREKCEREHKEQEEMKPKLLKIAELGEWIKDIVIGTGGGEKKAEKRVTEIVFLFKVLLSHDRVRQRNVTLAGNTIQWEFYLF